MVSMPPQCRQKLQAENLGPYPRSGCLKCGWHVTESDIRTMCVEPGYMEDVSIRIAQRYREELNCWIDSICKHTGLGRHTPLHQPLIQVYVMLARVYADKIEEKTIHDSWAIWTLLTRGEHDHPNMIPFDHLDDRTKALDKIDMWAIKKAAEECSG